MESNTNLIAIYRFGKLCHPDAFKYVLENNANLFDKIYVEQDLISENVNVNDFDNVSIIENIKLIPRTNNTIVCEFNPNILIEKKFIEWIKNNTISENTIYTFNVECYDTYSELTRSINGYSFEGTETLVKLYKGEVNYNKSKQIKKIKISCLGNTDTIKENYYNFVFDDRGGKPLRENLRNLNPSLYWPVSLKTKDQPRIFSKRFRNQIDKYRTISIMEYNKKSLESSIKLDTSKIPTYNHNQILKVLTSYYEVENDSRRKEVEFSIKKNIENENINEVIIFTENLKKQYEFLKHKKVKEIKIKNRFSFKIAMDYIKKEQNLNTVYTVCNSDCYFDESINLLKKINFKKGKRVLAMTRKDLVNGEILDSISLSVFSNEKYEFEKEIKVDYSSNVPIISIESNDAWSFTYETANAPIDFDIELGRWNCEPNFCSRLHSAGYELRNVGHGNHIRCIHVHQTNLRYKNKCHPQFSSKSCLETEKITTDNYVVNSWYPMSNLNYIFDDRFSGEYGEFFVRDIKTLFN